MSIKTDNKKIVEYYDKTRILYKLFWSKNALHFGLWNKDTKNLTEVLTNTDKFICECLQINEADCILDAGCGVGGTSIYIAEKSKADVYGITLSEKQLKTARRESLRSKADKSLNFSKQNFIRTNFKRNTFTKIFGIESICHAHKKIDFLREAYRILKKEGRIAVLDAFLTRTNFSRKEKKLYEDFLSGFELPNLSTKDDFNRDLKKTGFKNIRFYDKLNSVKKSTRRVHNIALIAYPITFCLYLLKIIPKTIHGNTIACFNAKRLVDNDMVTYGAFVADKR